MEGNHKFEEPSRLSKVYLAGDVYSMCLNHALTTEKEEVMGLLIGEVDQETATSFITAYKVLHRSDKQPDRVEISPDQLCLASNYAEQLQHRLQKPMRVLGWYHSHPHITVWPSHIDIRTQAMYQSMDPFFVGLIFSVYTSEGGSTNNQIQVTCFQANCLADERIEIPLIIKPSPIQPYNLEGIADLPKILAAEELQHEEVKSTGDEIDDLHNDALKTLAMVHLVSHVTRPIYEHLEERISTTKVRIAELQKLKAELTAENDGDDMIETSQ